MRERVEFGKIESIGKGILKITSGGVSTVITENAAPRLKDMLNIPEGTLSSLRPVLRGIMGSDTENDEGYWAQIDAMAIMEPQVAANKLKKAGFGYVQTAELLVKTDSLVNQHLAHGDLNQEEVSAKITEVAEVIHQLFISHPSKKNK